MLQFKYLQYSQWTNENCCNKPQCLVPGLSWSCCLTAAWTRNRRSWEQAPASSSHPGIAALRNDKNIWLFNTFHQTIKCASLQEKNNNNNQFNENKLLQMQHWSVMTLGIFYELFALIVCSLDKNMHNKTIQHYALN